ncbi:MAG: histidine kinase, partial [Bacteroidota bacterium]
MLRFTTVLICILYLSTIRHSNAQTTTYAFHEIEKLSSKNDNLYLFKDKLGFVWISSVSGLNKFDGSSTKTYFPDPNDGLSIKDANVHSQFVEDQQGNLWFATISGINQYDRKQDCFHTFTPSKKASSEYQILFHDSTKQELWIRDKNDLFTFSLVTKSKQRDIRTFEMNRKTKVFHHAAAAAYHIVLTDQDHLQLHTIHPNTHKQAKISKYSSDNNLQLSSAPYMPDSAHIFIGTNEGLKYFDLRLEEEYLFNELSYGEQKISELSLVLPYGEDQLMVHAQEQGIFLFDIERQIFTEEIKYWENGRSRAFEQVSNIYLDEDENLWVSVPDKGVVYTNLNKKRFDNLLPGVSINSIYQDQAGTVFVSSKENIYQFSAEYNAKMIPFDQDDIYSISGDKNDNLWVASASGLFRKQAQSVGFQRIPLDEDESRFLGVPHVIRLDDSTMLTASQFYGVNKVDTSNPNEIAVESLEPLTDITKVHALLYQPKTDKNTLIACQYNYSINIFKQNKADWELDTSLLFQPPVQGIVQDLKKPNVFWVASDLGLYKITDHQQNYTLDRVEQFTFKSLKGVLQDRLSNLWISSSEGLIKYHPDTHEYQRFTRADGLQDEEFNAWSCYELGDGSFAFGGIEGINIFNPYTIQPLKVQAKPSILSIKINSEEIDLKPFSAKGISNVTDIEHLTLSYENNTLAFDFGAMEYSEPEANQFRYQLVNLDEEIIDQGNGHSIRYPNLSSGDYILKVQATNSDEVWAPITKQLRITILAPWYIRPWAIVIWVSLGLGIIYAFARYRIEQVNVKRREAELERDKAELERDKAELELDKEKIQTAVFRLQMNPHFLFNSMNAIAGYVTSNKADEVYEYISNFSDLMRTILDSSEQYLTAIEDEIDLLELYLKTENMRLEGKLNYEFIVDEKIDSEETLLPTMLLQPFVENAIWHGISPKKDKRGLIQIRFLLVGEQLICEVEDNGVGRDARANRTKKHKSKALNITKRRLDLLSKDAPEHVKCT